MTTATIDTTAERAERMISHALEALSRQHRDLIDHIESVEPLAAGVAIHFDTATLHGGIVWAAWNATTGVLTLMELNG